MRELGVKEFREETLRWDWDGFLSFIERLSPDLRVQAIESSLPHTSPAWPDLVAMRVVARKGTRTATYDTLDAYEHRMDMSAMARTTGFSAAAVAHEVARPDSRIPVGVMAPEELSGAVNSALIESLSRDLDIRISGV
jgi:saccharopine dehydrogenase-like NADP-dependent oxidoreductase